MGDLREGSGEKNNAQVLGRYGLRGGERVEVVSKELPASDLEGPGA
jgi:hypothetical protein